MITKHRRILIAEEQYAHRLCLERMFNELGYYCIFPTGNFGDLLTIVSNSVTPLDLMVVNYNLAPRDLNILTLFEDYGATRYCLLYNANEGCVYPARNRTPLFFTMALPARPESGHIERILELLEQE